MIKQLVLFSAFALLASCGGKQDQVLDDGPTVKIQESDLKGTPANFNGTWSGACSAKTNSTTSVCNSVISLTQSAMALKGSVTYFFKQSGANNLALNDIFIHGNDLYSGSETVGHIGTNALQLTASGSSTLAIKMTGVSTMWFELKAPQSTATGLTTIDVIGSLNRE